MCILNYRDSTHESDPVIRVHFPILYRIPNVDGTLVLIYGCIIPLHE